MMHRRRRRSERPTEFVEVRVAAIGFVLSIDLARASSNRNTNNKQTLHKGLVDAFPFVRLFFFHLLSSSGAFFGWFSAQQSIGNWPRAVSAPCHSNGVSVSVELRFVCINWVLKPPMSLHPKVDIKRQTRTVLFLSLFIISPLFEFAKKAFF